MRQARNIEWADDPGNEDVEAGAAEATEFTFVFQAGPIGMTFTDGGVVQDVPAAGQAFENGVAPGWHIVRVGLNDVEGRSMQAILGVLNEQKALGEDFEVTFVAPPGLEIKDRPLESLPSQDANVLGKAADDEGDLEMQPLTGGDGAAPQASAYTKPLWKSWPGRNWFCCGGALMTGGTEEFFCPNICVWSFIMVPCTFYFLWVFPALWHAGSYALPSFTLIIFLITTGSLLATCCSDPGIIPRREVILATDDAARLEAVMGYNPLGASSTKEGDSQIPRELNGAGYRWCRTCKIIRPPRSSHCPDCDNCVLRYDHHCPFVNNCVGQRNYHFFFGFVSCVWCLALLVLPAILWYMTSRDIDASLEGLVRIERKSGMFTAITWILIAAGALAILAAIASMCLWFYHLGLIMQGKTTKEYRKELENIGDEPTLCAARGPCLFDPWAMVNPRDLLPDQPIDPTRSKGKSKRRDYR